ncbi:Wound-induced protein 1 [Dendrobium catenatum]|uniref:Wound-induced protein 1 n=1 Tax=Dendrobium catenatum TaxID=906689 RepID=A0A2I0VX52_9ASPA|nr:Wound-induced protein 1 [Dendrobium catenatum]
MKRLLTGEHEKFHFLIHSVQAFGPKVIAEGTDLSGSDFWVHAWTVSDGIITQVREYFNTCVTVTRVGDYGLPVWQSTLHESVGKSLPALVLAI